MAMAKAPRFADPADGGGPAGPASAVKEILVLVKELEQEWYVDDRIAYMTRTGRRDQPSSTVE